MNVALLMGAINSSLIKIRTQGHHALLLSVVALIYNVYTYMISILSSCLYIYTYIFTIHC